MFFFRIFKVIILHTILMLQNCLGTIYTVFIESLPYQMETLIGNILGRIQVRFTVKSSDSILFCFSWIHTFFEVFSNERNKSYKKVYFLTSFTLLFDKKFWRKKKVYSKIHNNYYRYPQQVVHKYVFQSEPVTNRHYNHHYHQHYQWLEHALACYFNNWALKMLCFYFVPLWQSTSARDLVNCTIR